MTAFYDVSLISASPVSNLHSRFIQIYIQQAGIIQIYDFVSKEHCFRSLSYPVPYRISYRRFLQNALCPNHVIFFAQVTQPHRLKNVCMYVLNLNHCILLKHTVPTLEARGGVVDKALRYKPAGRGLDSRWYHWNFSVT